jgi:hypothetical protein
VHRAEVPHDGPTSKADCLNWIVQNILLYEQRSGERFDVFLMHDAEDVVHPYGLKTVNWFVDDVAMIQMPVLSMDRKWTQLVACHYMDEFAEFHTKDLPVRSAILGMTPSAGVATAFHRLAMLALVAEKQGQPFNTDSLTEDYDVGHRLSGGLRRGVQPECSPSGRKNLAPRLRGGCPGASDSRSIDRSGVLSSPRRSHLRSHNRIDHPGRGHACPRTGASGHRGWSHGPSPGAL